MQTTQESKSQLAKLMATENLTVEFKKVPTAYFNLKERKLVVPILKEGLTSDISDLFVGHEIGHALYTPEQGWHDSVIDLKIPKAILNVVEDARIEKLIKRKYPGLRVPFSKAYRELLSRDFFATTGVDLNGMNILDRLNIHFKIGASLGIKFDDEELFLVKEIENLETFDDVIEVSKKIMALYRQEKEKRKQKNQDEPIEPTDEWEDDTHEYSFDDSNDDGDEVTDERDSPNGSPKSSNDPQDENSQDIEYSDNEDFSNTDDMIKSHTDDAFRKHEKQLVSVDLVDYEYGDIPEDINLDNIIVSYKHIINRYKEESFYDNTFNNDAFNNFKKKSSKVVSYLVKEFEMRKNADQMKRASVAKTGELNMSKIYSYKFNDDIFKRLTIVPGGKSHGLIMFLDWSGSMVPYLNATIKQLLNLVLFCKKVNIPFEVYAFSNRFYYPSNESKDHSQVRYKTNEIKMKPFHLMNLLSSKMAANELAYMSSILLYGSEIINQRSYNSRMRGFPSWMQLQYTPINEAIFSAIKIIPKFQKENKLQIVNTVFLTDGEGHQLQTKEGSDINRFRTNAIQMAVMRHKSSGITEKVKESFNESYTAAALNILKQVTNTNVIGFYLVSSREFRQQAGRLFPKTANVDDIRQKFMKEKNVTCISSGYDEYYIIRAETDVDENSEIEVKSNTTRSLVTAFTKYNTNKIINRVVLNRFIGLIT